MASHPTLRFLDAAWLRKNHGVVVVFATVVSLEIFRTLGIAAPNPQLFTALAITYAAYSGGYAGGLAGAAVGVGYALYFFSSPGDLFHYTDISRAKVIVNLITLPAIAVLVSRLNYLLAKSIRSQTGRFIERANAPILGLDRTGKVTIWNENLEKITGRPEEEITGQDLAALLANEVQRTALGEAIDAALDGMDSPSLERFQRTRNHFKDSLWA